ncbi:MAG: preprotein translocase subunit SecA [Planctomycetes bacterium]|nr:preprotein translocase subunit SecA [Planctomycetota bacterium]
MLALLGRIFVKLIGGTRNERLVRSMSGYVGANVNTLEGRFLAMSDSDLRAVSDRLHRRLTDGERPQALMGEAFAAVREASRRARAHRQFDVQLVAGQVLHAGNIAEEATGEGKTIACYPAIYMMALQGRKVHIVTVNDYLVRRDAEFAGPIFAALGLTVGYIQSDMENAHRQAAYACDVTYGTNSEFGFDYLRDHMKLSPEDQVQGSLDFAIVDEVDNILIDEARTPLIISGPAYGDVSRYVKADSVARRLEALQKQANHETMARIRQWGDKRPAEYGADPKFKEALKKFKADSSQRSGFALTEDEAVALGHRQYFVVNAENKNVGMTHDGVTAAQEDRQLGAIYQDGMEWPHLITQSLRARLVYEKDRDYVVRNGDVIIVDEFTGRLMEGRQWSDGLHQAVEAKEGVPVKQENQTLATITLQNYFKLYDKLAGMTGTAMTESDEFMKIYHLDVVSVPTHRPVNRVDYNDRIYRSEGQKFQAIVDEIHKYCMSGRPVLVGTTSVEKSERLSDALTHQYGIKHEVLNARPENAAREADIIVAAGCRHPLKKGSDEMVGNVTIATNMAGRGTDIKLAPETVHTACHVPADAELPAGVSPSRLYPAGVNKCCLHCQEYDAATSCAHCFKPKIDPDFPIRGRTACRQDVPCGLHVVGTERHEARRIDNQLRGRSGRQGDPGSSRFFLSLEDDLLRVFAGPTVLKLLDWLGMEDGLAIEHKHISKALEKAQKRVEQRNFDIRKHLLEYDEIMDYQRRTFYEVRQRILEGRDLNEIIVDMIVQTIADGVAERLGGPYGKQCICDWARANLRLELDPGQVRAEEPDDFNAVADNLRSRAKDDALADISRSLGEYVDPEMPIRDWDLGGLGNWTMSRYGVSISQAKLRQMTPEQIAEALSEAANERIDQIDLAPLAAYLGEDFSRRALAQWSGQKFGLKVDANELVGDVERVAQTLTASALAAYRQREIEYPVEYAMQLAFPDGETSNVFHCAALAEWINAKYRASVAPEQFEGRRGEEILAGLIQISREYAEGGRLAEEVARHLDSAHSPAEHVRFAAERFDTTLDDGDFDGAEAREVIIAAGQRFLRREIGTLERFVLLQEYDSAWKDHLLEMDHLKSGIGLRGYAEQDPKIAYKREGAELFREMFDGVRNRVSENIFKVRLSASARLANVYQISNMVHEELVGYDHLAQEMAAQQQAAKPQKVQTIRRAIPKVGRNELCPCGSGKKFKKCCGKDS